MRGWTTYKLCEVANLSTGFPFDGHKYAKTGLRVVRGDNVTIGELRWNTDKDKRWNEPFARAEEFSLREGDIVIGMDGSRVGRNRAQIQLEDLPLLLAQRVACVRHNDKTLQKFLYYQIFSKRFETYIKSVHTGTSIPHVSLKQIGDFSLQVPDLPTQRRIAGILGLLDDKIELNRRINANLEAQAQALFRSWFVDFEPFRDGPFVDSELGKIPQGWKVAELQTLVTIKRGGSPRPIQSFLSDSGYNWLKISDATSEQSPYIYDIKEHIKESGVNKTVYIKSGELVLSNSATPGIPKILGVDSCIHDGWLYFPKSSLSNEFLYLLFKENREKFLSQGNGSVFLNLKTDILKSFKIIVPNNLDKLKEFNIILQNLFKEIKYKTEEIKTLSALRDTLLPKLLSGDIKC